MEALFGFIREIVETLWPFEYISPWERGLRVRFGRWMKVLNPGVHLIIPYFDRVEVVSITDEPAAFPIVGVDSFDGHHVQVQGAIGYRIEDVRLLHMSIQDHEEWLINLVQERVAEFISDHTLDEIDKPAIERSVKPSLRRRAKKVGIEITGMYLSDLITDTKTVRLLTEGNSLF